MISQRRQPLPSSNMNMPVSNQQPSEEDTEDGEEDGPFDYVGCFACLLLKILSKLWSGREGFVGVRTV